MKPSNDFLMGLVSFIIVVVGLALAALALAAIRLAFNWVNDTAYRYFTSRTCAIPEEVLPGDQRMKDAQALAEKMAMSPTFRVVRLFGFYIVICRDFRKRSTAAHGRPENDGNDD